MASMPVPRVFNLQITSKLPVSLLESIQQCGQVLDTGRFSVAESVSTFAGSVKGKVDARGVNAQFNIPYGMCFHPPTQSIFVCDFLNNAIRKMSLQGDVSTFVDSSFVELKGPMGIALNHKEDAFYIVNYYGHNITRISAKERVASSFTGCGDNGKEDGIGKQASFSNPTNITIDQQTGNIYVCDYGNHLIRKVSPNGDVSTLAGSTPGYLDGNGKHAKFNNPFAICFDVDSQSLVISDHINNRLRKVLLNGDVSTLCEIPNPRLPAITENKTIIVSSGNYKLYKVQQGAQNIVSVLAGSWESKRIDGEASKCSFSFPNGILVHEESHSCFVSDYQDSTIRRVSFVNP
jgi:DNA-binding beta-propeller fold protein YncE